MATPISKPIADSEPPQYIAGQDGEPSRYEIPNEAGYFPAGSDDIGAVAELENVTLYQIHPRYHGEKKVDKPLARGKLTVRDPDGGTADDVVLVVEFRSSREQSFNMQNHLVIGTFGHI